LATYDGPAGGFLLPTEMVNSLELAMLAFGGMLQVAEIIRTANGDQMIWPMGNDTTNTGEQLSESTSVGSSVDPTFSSLTLEAYKMSSKLILVPVELLEDSPFNLTRSLATCSGTTRAGQQYQVHNRQRRRNTQGYHIGDHPWRCRGGSERHHGRRGDRPGAQCRRGLPQRRGLHVPRRHPPVPAQAEGRRESLPVAERHGLGGPDTLYGYPTTINNDMQATVATATKTMIFGQLSAYKVRQVSGIRLVRLVERYADTDQVAFIAFLREDGDLLDAGGHPVKHLLQA